MTVPYRPTMMTAFECFEKARELSERATEASDTADRTKLRAMGLYWTILGEHVKARETGRSAVAGSPVSGSPRFPQ